MTSFERWLLWIGVGLVSITGVIYGWMKYFVTSADPLAVANHEWQPAMHAAHIIVAPVLVFALGSIAVRHTWRHWRRGTRTGRRSGLLAALAAVPMIMSGYLVQTVASPRSVTITIWMHLGGSAVFVLGFLVHQKVRRTAPPGDATGVRLELEHVG